MQWSLRSLRSLRKYNFRKLIGGFTSPLYTKCGSGETALRYPNDAPHGRWVGGQKDPAKLGLFVRHRVPRLDAAAERRSPAGEPMARISE